MIHMELEIAYIGGDGRHEVKRISDADTSITLVDEGIRDIDLSPLSECTQLVRLDLSSNSLESIDLTPLSSCTQLEDLDLSSNSLESIDLSPLSECTQLVRLDLSSNSLESIDLTPLSKCSHRVELRVDESVRLVAEGAFVSVRRVPDSKIFERDSRMLIDTMTMLLRAAGESQQTIRGMQHALVRLQVKADDTWLITIEVLSVALGGFRALSTGQYTLEQVLSDVADRLEKVARQWGVDRSVRDESQALFKEALRRGTEKGDGAAIWYLVRMGLAAVGRPLPL